MLPFVTPVSVVAEEALPLNHGDRLTMRTSTLLLDPMKHTTLSSGDEDESRSSKVGSRGQMMDLGLSSGKERRPATKPNQAAEHEIKLGATAIT